MDNSGGTRDPRPLPRVVLRRLDPQDASRAVASDEFRGRFDHPDSNYRMTREVMLGKAPVPRENIHPVLADGAADEAACAMSGHYRRTMARRCWIRQSRCSTSRCLDLGLMATPPRGYRHLPCDSGTTAQSQHARVSLEWRIFARPRIRRSFRAVGVRETPAEVRAVAGAHAFTVEAR
jgi:hypothetical protein